MLSVKYKQVCRCGDVLEYFFAARDFVKLIQLAEEMHLYSSWTLRPEMSWWPGKTTDPEASSTWSLYLAHPMDTCILQPDHDA